MASHSAKPSQLRIAQFDTDGAREFLAEMHRRGISRSSAARRLASLRSFARYLVREQKLADDPTAIVVAPRREQTLPAHLPVDDINRLLEMPDVTTRAGRRDHAILELFYASGLRLSELVDLDLEDVNLNGRMVRVRGKGGKERLVPFNQTAAEAIRFSQQFQSRAMKIILDVKAMCSEAKPIPQIIWESWPHFTAGRPRRRAATCG